MAHLFQRLPARVLASLLPLVALTGCETKTTDDSIEPITMETLRKDLADGHLGDRLIILDARSPREFAAGRIPGAKNLSWERIGDTPRDQDPRVERYKDKVVYGADRGSASAKALTKRMLQAGYSNVRMYFGGLEEWTRAGYPVESGEPRPGANQP